MPALSINGITVPVALNSWERPSDILLGDRGRGTSGRMESAVRVSKPQWRGRMTPLGSAEAAAFRGLLQGQGHSWSFDANLFSGKGLGPSLATGCGVVAFSKYGTGAVQIDPTRTLEYSLPGSATQWTLSFWRYALQLSLAGWEHWVLLGDGSVFKAGASTAEAPWSAYDGATLRFESSAAAYPAWEDGETYATDELVYAESLGDAYRGVYRCDLGGTSLGDHFDTAPNIGDSFQDDGGVQWTRVDDGYGYFDDVMFWPFLAPTSWVSQIYAEAAARAWAQLPNLRASGDLVGTRSVQGRLASGQPVAQQRAGGLDRAGDALGFELVES